MSSEGKERRWDFLINVALYRRYWNCMSLPLWVGGGPVRARCGGSSLAELYGLAWIVRVSCTVVVGVGALVGTQSRFVSEFPPSVRLTPATFPQGGRLFGFAHAFLDAPRKGGF